MDEHSIQNAIRLELSKRGFCVFRMNVGKFKLADGRWFDTMLPKGTSDLLAVRKGRAYWLEVKTETGKPSKEQLNFIEQMRERYGCKAGIVRSVEDAVRLVEGD